MKNSIKTSIAAAIIATGALGASAALAWGGHCDGSGPRGGMGGWSQMEPEQMEERMSQRVDLHLARLELALVLSPAQKPAFDTFKAEMKARAERMASAMAERRTGTRPATAVECMQRMEEMGKLRQSEMAEARKTVETFYATLGEAQKIVFDAEFQKMGPRDGMGERGLRDGSGAGGGGGAGMRSGRG